MPDAVRSFRRDHAEHARAISRTDTVTTGADGWDGME
jgi:hypothetical protein